MIKSLTVTFLICLLLSAGPRSAEAQDDDSYHPYLSDRFNIGLGYYYPKKSLTLRVDGSSTERDIDFDESLKLDETEATPNLTFRWRMGEKWSLWGQYWQVSSAAGAVLDEDVQWGDVVFQAGTFAKGGFDVDIARVFFGREFLQRPGHELGIGIGLHWMQLGAYLEGQILTNQGDTEFYRGSVDADIPLPNIGGWYMWSWSPKWVFLARIDWLSASIGDYSGGLWNANAGINWQFSKHFGVGLSYQTFTLNVDVDKSDWHGKAEADQHGPMLSLTASW